VAVAAVVVAVMPERLLRPPRLQRPQPVLARDRGRR
jgi:hypothetical protein